MSVIFITEHNENIYNSTKKATTFHKKSPRYVSKYRATVEDDINSKRKHGFATMGLPSHPLPNPSDYLKKKSGKHYKVPVKAVEVPTTEKKAPVPSTRELLEEDRNRKRRSPPNFVSVNVKDVLKMKTKEPAQRVVVNRYGNTKELSAGLEPVYIYESGFGKTPEYLVRFIKARERNLQFKKDTTGTEQPICRYITKEERDNLLAGLKENWEELQKSYQGLPILTDTIPKMHRKSKLEAELKQIEKDIVLLERHPYIYVYDDNEIPN